MKTLKIILITLIIILLSTISFVGIYVKDKNSVKNVLQEYTLARDLNDYRIVELKVNDEKNEIKYDAEGKEIADTDTETEVAKTEEKAVNPEEILTSANYKTTKSIVEKRLATMGITDYSIKQNNENGTIIVELPNNDITKDVASQLALKGKFEVVDNDTKEVLMTNADIESVKAGYGTSSSNTAAVYINFQFNQEGTKKFKNITNTYVETTVKKETENSEGQAETTENTQTEETQTENVVTEATVEQSETQAQNAITEATTEQQVEAEDAETEGGEEDEDSEETVTREIAIKVDDVELLTTHFDKEISNGFLQLTMGSGTTSVSELQKYLVQANALSAELNSGIMPIEYETGLNEVITAKVTVNEMKVVLVVSVAVLAIALLFIIVKYKLKGILASISLIGYIAILLLALRYFNVTISKDGILAILFVIAVSYGIILSILKNKEVLKTVGKCTVALIPTLIIAISLTFANVTIGAVLFWGVCIALLYHISISNLMLED